MKEATVAEKLAWAATNVGLGEIEDFDKLPSNAVTLEEMRRANRRALAFNPGPLKLFCEIEARERQLRQALLKVYELQHPSGASE